MKKILFIQTAFIGDVLLGTSLIEKLSTFYSNLQIDFLLRKGNELLLQGHPKLNAVLIWYMRFLVDFALAIKHDSDFNALAN